MMKGNMLFSQEALDKLRSPDRLDKMFSITKSLDWMLIVAVMVFLFAIVLWSIFGAFTEKIDGMGLITDSAGVAVVTPASSGKLDKIYDRFKVHKQNRKIVGVEYQVPENMITFRSKLRKCTLTEAQKKEATERIKNVRKKKV